MSVTLTELVRDLSELYEDREIVAWLVAPQKLLGGQKPFDLIRNGDIERVQAIVSQLLDGAYA